MIFKNINLVWMGLLGPFSLLFLNLSPKYLGPYTIFCLEERAAEPEEEIATTEDKPSFYFSPLFS